MTLASTLRRRLVGRPEAVPFVYKDYGSLVSLSDSSVGELMGNLLGSVMLEGRIARLTYLSLYKKHQLAVHGLSWVVLATLINLLRLRTEPRLKLHQRSWGRCDEHLHGRPRDDRRVTRPLHG